MGGNLEIDLGGSKEIFMNTHFKQMFSCNDLFYLSVI